MERYALNQRRNLELYICSHIFTIKNFEQKSEQLIESTFCLNNASICTSVQLLLNFNPTTERTELA